MQTSIDYVSNRDTCQTEKTTTHTFALKVNIHVSTFESTSDEMHKHCVANIFFNKPYLHLKSLTDFS